SDESPGSRCPTEGSGADPEPAGAAGASAQKSRSNEERSVGQRSSAGGEPDSPPWCPASLGVFQTRSIFHLPRRSSSGYFSADGADSVPSSPLFLKRLTADKATQTRSPSGQVIEHAMGRMADEAHEAVGRALRRIGDDYDRILMVRVRDGQCLCVCVSEEGCGHRQQPPADTFVQMLTKVLKTAVEQLFCQILLYFIFFFIMVGYLSSSNVKPHVETGGVK
uniref:Uncharacterized protein n=1 Tax=Stegastes partitus TaxID=144197 RepID=A0A3B5B3B7_9TELE